MIMKEKIKATFVLAMLVLIIAFLLDVSSAAVPIIFENSDFRTPNRTSAPPQFSISSEAPGTQWNRTYGGIDPDRAYSMVNTSDGGYAIAGETSSYGAGYNDFWLVRTDSTGNALWNKTYGGPDADRAYFLVETNDGGYALAGYTASLGAGNYDFWLVKTDSSGNVLWNRTYGGTNNDIAHSLIQTNDEGYLMAGDSASYGAGSYDFWLVKTDSVGNTQWNRTYGGTNNDIARSLIQTNDGGYAIAGETSSYGAGYNDFWLVKTDSTGNALWNKTYGGTSSDIAHSLIQTDDGGYALTGNTKSYGAGGYDFWLVKTDSAGNALWNKTYGGTGHDLAYSMIQTSNGGYAIVGDSASFGVGGYDFWLIKTDSSGNMQWNQTYGGSNNDICWSLVQTSDGGYGFAGYTGSYGAGSDDFLLIKIEGETETGTHDVATIGVVPSKTIVGQGFSMSINVTVMNQGDYSESFNVIAYVNTTAIEAETLTLESGNSATITFTWSTIDFAKSNYTLSAIVDLMPPDIDIDPADNTYTYGLIKVTIPGDLNGDHSVNVLDAILMATHFGKPSEFPNGDINNDGAIDAIDAAILSLNYGQSE